MRRWALIGGAGLSFVALLVVARWWSGTRAEHVASTIDAGSIVLLGDSITEGGDWPSLLPEVPLVNEGHSGFTTEQLIPVADEIARRQPRAVFVLTGTNDIRDDHPAVWTGAKLAVLLDAFEDHSPTSIIVVQTVLPRADAPAAVQALNSTIVELATARGLRVLDLHPAFDDGSGGLRTTDTTDGVHLTNQGYERWAAMLATAIASLEAAAA